MPKIPSYQDSMGNQTPMPSRGWAAVPNAGAGFDALRQLGQVGADLAQQVQRNRTAVELAKAGTEFINEIDEKELEFRTDREYSTQADRYGKWLKEKMDEYQQRFRGNEAGFHELMQSINPYALRKGVSIKSNAIQQDMQAQQAIVGSTLANMSSIAVRGDDEHFKGIVQEGRELIEKSYASGIMDAGERARFEQKFLNDLGRGKARHDINRDPVAALQRIQSGGYEGLSAEEQAQFESMAMTAIAQNQNKAAHELTKNSKEMVRDAVLAFENGYVLKPEEIAAAEEAAKLVGLHEDFRVAKAASEYIRLPKATRDGLPETLTGLANVEMRQALEKADEIIHRELDKDGYSFAVRQGLVEKVELDLRNPAQLNQMAIKARIDQSEYLGAHYGRPVSPLTEAEADFLTQALPVMSPASKTQLAQVLGPSSAIWEQLDRKNAGTFAMLGAIGDSEVMTTAFKGQARMADKMLTPLNPNDYLPVFDDYVGDVYLGKDRKAMLSAAMAYYAGSTQSQEFDPGEFEKAIEAVSGGIAKINGRKVELPRGVDEDTFEDFIDSISPETVRAFGGVWSMTDSDAAMLIRESNLVSIGSNRYMIERDGAVLIKPSGDEFVLSFDAELFRQDQERGKFKGRKR